MTSSDIPDSSGIYQITCTANSMFYIGSAVNLRNRWRQHRQSLQRGDHDNVVLQRTWDKYGPDAFTFGILELVVLPDLLTAREQHYLDTLKPFGTRGFNIARVAGSTLGVKYSQETRQRLRDIAAHRPPPSDASKEKWRQARLGYRHTPETRAKISAAHIGIRPWLGKNHTPETKEKLRQARIGKKRPPEVVAKMIAAKTGFKAAPDAYAARKKTLILTDPDGAEYIAHGIKRFAREHGLDGSALMRVARGKQPAHKGWRARFPD